ncbi:hypothetical protein PF006_g10326 [Phytophthora fragariae]|uniref:Uncharacterized protein n=1 Tax=Phytophthora fragariae TaxID=53985 RepID=A0A6A3KWK9_9STRA|nr:hypothetical protein PF011_g10014 [Phytophthora fragariae]KAE9144770.1 hypothetical protein PF006_g10326 [Phytophthora fragariae]
MPSSRVLAASQRWDEQRWTCAITLVHRVMSSAAKVMTGLCCGAEGGLRHDTRPVSALRAHDETGCIGCVKVARIRKRGKRQIASRVVLPRGGKGRSHRSSPQLPRVKERSRGQLRYPPFLLI